MSIPTNHRPVMLLLLLAAAFAGGCGRKMPRMGQYTYRMSLAESLRDQNTRMMPSIEVDFIGVKEPELYRWEKLDIDEYFTPGNRLRANARRLTMVFTNAKAGNQILFANEKIWDLWKGSKYMFIIAGIPLDPTGYAKDPRRLKLPLDRSRWERGKPIEIWITPGGIAVATPMIPKRN